jgi:hypothetical protein
MTQSDISFDELREKNLKRKRRIREGILSDFLEDVRILLTERQHEMLYKLVRAHENDFLERGKCQSDTRCLSKIMGCYQGHVLRNLKSINRRCSKIEIITRSKFSFSLVYVDLSEIDVDAGLLNIENIERPKGGKGRGWDITITLVPIEFVCNTHKKV